MTIKHVWKPVCLMTGLTAKYREPRHTRLRTCSWEEQPGAFRHFIQLPESTWHGNDKILIQPLIIIIFSLSLSIWSSMLALTLSTSCGPKPEQRLSSYVPQWDSNTLRVKLLSLCLQKAAAALKSALLSLLWRLLNKTSPNLHVILSVWVWVWVCRVCEWVSCVCRVCMCVCLPTSSHPWFSDFYKMLVYCSSSEADGWERLSVPHTAVCVFWTLSPSSDLWPCTALSSLKSNTVLCIMWAPGFIHIHHHTHSQSQHTHSQHAGLWCENIESSIGLIMILVNGLYNNNFYGIIGNSCFVKTVVGSPCVHIQSFM